MPPEVKVSVGDAHAISSSKFVFSGYTCELEDDGSGNIRIIRVDNDLHDIIKNIGTVVYASGTVQLNTFVVDSFEGSVIKVYAKTLNKDISSGKNNIIRIEPDEILINVIEVSQ